MKSIAGFSGLRKSSDAVGKTPKSGDRGNMSSEPSIARHTLSQPSQVEIEHSAWRAEFTRLDPLISFRSIRTTEVRIVLAESLRVVATEESEYVRMDDIVIVRLSRLPQSEHDSVIDFRSLPVARTRYAGRKKA